MFNFKGIFRKKPKIIIDYQNGHTCNLETIRIKGNHT